MYIWTKQETPIWTITTEACEESEHCDKVILTLEPIPLLKGNSAFYPVSLWDSVDFFIHFSWFCFVGLVCFVLCCCFVLFSFVFGHHRKLIQKRIRGEVYKLIILQRHIVFEIHLDVKLHRTFTDLFIMCQLHCIHCLDSSHPVSVFSVSFSLDPIVITYLQWVHSSYFMIH